MQLIQLNATSVLCWIDDSLKRKVATFAFSPTKLKTKCIA